MNKFGKVSLALTSLILPVTILVSGFVAWQFKESNPNNVDITNEMAYLKQILGTTLVTFALLWVSSLATALIGLKKDPIKGFSKLSLVLLVIVTVLSIAGGMVTNAAGDAEEAYRDKQTTEYLQKLKQ